MSGMHDDTTAKRILEMGWGQGGRGGMQHYKTCKYIIEPRQIIRYYSEAFSTTRLYNLPELLKSNSSSLEPVSDNSYQVGQSKYCTLQC